MWHSLLAVYVAFAAIAGYFCIKRIITDRRLTGRIIAAIILYATIHIAGTSHLVGWPAPQSLPEEFVFIHGIVQEPDVRYSSNGKIWIWTRIKEKPDAPYSIELPYSETLAREVENLNKKASAVDGEIVVVTQELEDEQPVQNGKMNQLPEPKLISPDKGK